MSRTKNAFLSLQLNHCDYEFAHLKNSTHFVNLIYFQKFGWYRGPSLLGKQLNESASMLVCASLCHRSVCAVAVMTLTDGRGHRGYNPTSLSCRQNRGPYWSCWPENMRAQTWMLVWDLSLGLFLLFLLLPFFLNFLTQIELIFIPFGKNVSKTTML